MTLSTRLVSLLVVLIAIGLTSIFGQLILLRELVAVFYGNELVLGLILATWMAWVAVGAWSGGRIRIIDQSFHRLAAGLALTTLLLPIQIAASRASHRLLGVTPGALMPLLPMILSLVLILAPLCLLLGRLFTLSSRLLVAAGGNAGLAYAAESLGALVGGVIFSFLLVGRLDPFQIALGIGAVNLTLALGISLKHQLSRRGLSIALLALALLGAALPLGQWLHRSSLGWQYRGLLFVRDSPYGRIAITGQGEQRAFFVNGLLFFETQGTSAEEIAHLPLLAHPSPRRVLLIGGGVSGTLVEIFRHPSIQSVHYVELDPLLIVAARAELPSHQAAALDDPRLILVHQDGRLYVRQQRGLSPFDVIILDLPEPATGQLNRFYTQEFFAEVHTILAPDGLFALHLPWQENYRGPALQYLDGSIYRTLATEFAHTMPLPGGERLTLLASDTALPTGAATWTERLLERGIETRWVVPSVLDYLIRADRVREAQLVLETASDMRLNRDLTPISYYYDLSAWLLRFYGSLSRLIAQVSFFQLGWLVLLLAAVAFLLRRWPVPAAVGFTGLAGMTLEVILLFGFQVFHGYVYSQIGLLVTAFMAGLVLGAFVGGRWFAGRKAGTSGHPRLNPSKVLLRTQGGVFFLAIGCLVFLVFWKPPAWIFPFLLLVAGTLTGLVFPVAVAYLTTTEQPKSDQQPAGLIGILYSADLAGGCLGAILASVWWLPILGIPQTCLAVALFGLASFLVLLRKG